MASGGFKDSLERVKGDAARLLPSLGLERSATEGTIHPGGIPEFEERLSVEGNGDVTYLLRRPAGDQGGAEVGLYRGSLKPEEVNALLQLCLDSDLDKLEPAHPEPGAMKWGLALMAAGMESRFFTGTGDPAVLMPIKKLRSELDRIEGLAMHGPVWTLSLEAKPNPDVASGWREIVFRFANSGKEGIWIDHPAALDGKSPSRACHLVFGKAPQIKQGETPLPMETTKALLRYPPDSPRLLWVGPGAAVEVKGAIQQPANGPFLGRIAYACYPGEERTAGRRRFSGGVFSADFQF